LHAALEKAVNKEEESGQISEEIVPGFGGAAIRRTECHTGNPATAAAMPENDARTPAGTLFLQQAQGFVGRA
jgi:hypothetical protein